MTIPSIHEVIQYFHDALQLEDPGCSCHLSPPCYRCVESEDCHGNNVYKNPEPGDIIFYTDNETYSMEFTYDPRTGYRHLLTRALPSGDVIANGGHDLLPNPSRLIPRFRSKEHIANRTFPMFRTHVPSSPMKADFIWHDDIVPEGVIPTPPSARHHLDKAVINGICPPHETRTGPLLLRDAEAAGRRAGRTLANYLLSRSVHHACNLPSPNSHLAHLASRDTPLTED